jgi:hypothetical protein
VRLIDSNGDGGAVEMPVAAENSSDVSWSPDGTHIAYVDASDQVRIAPTEPPGEGFEITLPHEVGVPLDVSFSPEGNRVAFGAEELQQGGLQRIYVASASGGEAVRMTAAPVTSREPAWKPIPGAGGGGTGGGPGGGTGGGQPGGGSGGGSPGSGAPSGGSTGGGSSGGAKPTPLPLAAFRKPVLNPEFLGAAYVDCNLPGSNPICQASGEATLAVPMTNSLDYARTKAKPIVFAKGSVTVPNGKTLPLLLKITAKGRKLMKGRKTLKLTETVVETAPGAKPTTTTKTFTVAVPKPKH